MGYEYDEKGRIVYLDDSIDIGKEPLPIPEEMKEEHEKIRKRILEKYKIK